MTSWHASLVCRYIGVMLFCHFNSWSGPHRLERMYSFADGRNCHNRNLRCKVWRFPPNKNSFRRWELLCR